MNPQNGQSPLDYLNQIAPQPQRKPLFALNLRSVLMGAAVVIVLVIILAIVAAAVNSSRKEPWQQLSARLTTTQAVADSATSKLKNSQLRSINSDLKITLTNTQRDLAAPLVALGVDTKKLPEKITTEEAATDILARLETGRLNAKYDSTYAREMSFQVARVLALYQDLYANSGGTTKELINTAYQNLAPSHQALIDYTNTKE